MNELCHLPGFRHDAKLIEETGKSNKFQLVFENRSRFNIPDRSSVSRKFLVESITALVFNISSQNQTLYLIALE